jgi:hypothetical protein
MSFAKGFMSNSAVDVAAISVRHEPVSKRMYRQRSIPVLARKNQT